MPNVSKTQATGVWLCVCVIVVAVTARFTTKILREETKNVCVRERQVPETRKQGDKTFCLLVDMMRRRREENRSMGKREVTREDITEDRRDKFAVLQPSLSSSNSQSL